MGNERENVVNCTVDERQNGLYSHSFLFFYSSPILSPLSISLYYE